MSTNFWNTNKSNPLQKSRFQVTFGGKTAWWAKSVTQPTVDISVSEFQLVNHKIKVPGIATWTDVDIVFVEIGKIGKDLYDELVGFGYS